MTRYVLHHRPGVAGDIDSFFLKAPSSKTYPFLTNTICKFADASWAGDNVRTIEITRTSNRATP